MSTTDVVSTSQLDGIFDKSKDKVSVIDFHAEWCGPCKMIAPTFEKLAGEHKTVNFLRVDVDQAQDVAQRYEIRAMPTFVFVKGSAEVERIQGANPPALTAAVRRHASGSSGFSGKGQTLGGGPSGGAGGTDGTLVALQALDPQVKILLGLLGGYLLFWYFSST